MSQLKKLTGVALASAFASLVALTPLTVQAGSEVKAEGAKSDHAVVSESPAIRFEFSRNVGGRFGEFYD